MEEIETGEYVRTNKGNIGKVVEIRLGFNKDTQLYQNVYMLDNGLWTILEYIVKHSKQLIDLIEVGDIVNETRILDITGDYVLTTEYNCCKQRLNNKIKTILTKEQMEANCYKVGGEDEC